MSDREIARTHARTTAAILTAAAFFDDGDEDDEENPLPRLTGWRPGYEDELPPRVRQERVRRERCKTPGCTLFEFHSGLCTSQRVASKRERKPSAALRRAEETRRS